MATTASTVSLKLFIDTNARKVLYAEADKQFVDFLFYILSLPVASVVKFGDRHSMVGSLWKLYNSVNSLSDTYLQPTKDKTAILNPKLPILPYDVAPLLLPGNLFTRKRLYTCCNSKPSPHKTIYVSDQYSLSCPECSGSMCVELPYANAPGIAAPSGFVGEFFMSKKFYTCCRAHLGSSMMHKAVYVSDQYSIDCPVCSRPMCTEMPYVIASGKVAVSGSIGAGFVKGDVTYMVTDDLEVSPLSTSSTISVLSSFNVSDVRAIQEIEVQLGLAEGLKLMKAALSSRSVLTSVFLNRFV